MPDQIFLLPGEMDWRREPCVLATLLGSCVAVCLHDPGKGWGGMNHFMVPNRGQGPSLEAGKCGDSAIAALLRLAEMSGSRRGDLVAQVFGGGAVVGHLASVGQAGLGNIGDRNVAAARAALVAAGVRIQRHDTGGTQGRRVRFDTASGNATVAAIASTEQRAVREERLKEFAARRIRVLVVDDSATIRRIIRSVIEASDDLEVADEAADPFEARERILSQAPDVLTLDLIMPNLDGLSFLRRLMRFKPIPTVVVSTIAQQGSTMRAKVLEAGAVAVIDKEDLRLYQGAAGTSDLLLPALRSAATTAVKARP
ncbi:MAG: response regulator [Planctomycetes bacterium]|nr:response regulator [Planctomycetota bacterium]